jgi:putative transposase
VPEFFSSRKQRTSSFDFFRRVDNVNILDTLSATACDEFIQPGKPQQNSYIERYNRTIRYDWLAQHYLFSSIDEVQDYATRWLWTYNHERPNIALGGITPKQKLALAV